jgi:thymidylate synthase ThyX
MDQAVVVYQPDRPPRVQDLSRGWPRANESVTVGVQARVVCDSLSPFTQIRLTTVEVTLHHFVAKELLTHRAFSRNAASSRALPYKKFRRLVTEDPAKPLYWGKHQPGMGASEELDQATADECWRAILEHRGRALALHQLLEAKGLAKEIANRYLEPFFYLEYIMTGTEWDNFFWQRCHPAAQPEMRAAGDAIRAAMTASTPRERFSHLPYVTDSEAKSEVYTHQQLVMMSTARCARVSYLNHNGEYSPSDDFDLYRRLLNQQEEGEPPHISPFEHPAIAAYDDHMYANFRGWQQHRSKMERTPPKWQREAQ